MQMTPIVPGDKHREPAEAVLSTLRVDIEEGLANGRIPAMVVVRRDVLMAISDYAQTAEDIAWGPDGEIDALLDVPFEVGMPTSGASAAIVYADEIDLI